MKTVRLLLGTSSLFLVLSVFLALGPAGCSGGGAEVQSQHSTYTTTLGQELKDLEDAYKKGIITQQQYEDSKKKLIEQRTKEQ
jgi:competence protein ComGC